MGQKLNDSDEEDVDIDDDMPATTFPPVEIEKDEGPGLGDQDLDNNDTHGNNDCGNPGSSCSNLGSSSSESSSSSGTDTYSCVSSLY